MDITDIPKASIFQLGTYVSTVALVESKETFKVLIFSWLLFVSDIFIVKPQQLTLTVVIVSKTIVKLYLLSNSLILTYIFGAQ